MEKGSLVFCDTNVCIDRTLAFIEPQIFNDYLDSVKDAIAKLTNGKDPCKMLLSPVVISELKSNYILLKEIQNFCVKKLRYKRTSYKIMQIKSRAEKSIRKFIEKYSLSQDLIALTKDYGNNKADVENFYLKHPNTLKQITTEKLRGLSPQQKVRKIAQRPSHLPEENDLLLLAHAIELNNKQENPVAIFSRDKDFTKFKAEIPQEFGIQIFSL